jgi:chromosome segregation ATPase
MEQMQVDYMKAEEQRQEEMHAYLERIDALQAKLTYLARETVAAAKEANASAGNSLEKQVADKDEKIALLMEEGDKLSKNEMKHLQTIRKLRAKAVEDEKATADLKKKLERVEKSEAELKAKIRKAEAAERQANEKTRQIAVIEKQVDELRVDRENAADLVRSLTTQLKEAKERASQAEKEAASRAAEADKGVIANLQNELEDAQIEKKLAEDRASSEIQKARDEVERQKERFRVREMEFKSEISGLESRLEAMRSRAEEASTSSGVGDGESTLKLMRQVETLQQQYTMAKGNWETIESSLNARVLALGRERDEAVKRESDIRKKAREVGARSRKAEDELESTLERIRTLEQELKSQQENSQRLEEQLKDAETQISDNKADYDRQKRLWESEISSRVEEEKQKLKRELLATNSPYSNVNSPTPSSRKTSTAIDRPGSRAGKGLLRLTSHDHLPQIPDNTRPVSGTRRTPTFPTPSSASGRALPTYSEHPSPSLSRRESMLSLDPTSMPPTPSFDIQDNLDSEDGSYPQRTIADLVSTSTAGPGTGPSVQLVERMSSLVRKLESEKATFRDELTRLSQQRDDARNEVVSLMREIEEKQSEGGKVEKLEREIKALRERYEASLEMLGEREEEVEELRGDIVELKRIYKELVEAKIGGGAGGQQA